MQQAPITPPPQITTRMNSPLMSRSLARLVTFKETSIQPGLMSVQPCLGPRVSWQGRPEEAPRWRRPDEAGGPCRCPAVRDRKRCRLHGGRSTGAPKGPANGNIEQAFTAVIEERQWLTCC